MPNNTRVIMPDNSVVSLSQNNYTTLCQNNEVDSTTYYTIVDNSNVISGTKTFSCYDPQQRINYLEEEVKMLKETIEDLLNKQKFDE